MTLIISILNKDFSMISADKVAKTSGEFTLQAGGSKITVKSDKITINGYKKIYLNSKKNVAVAIAGAAQDHSYISSISNIEDIDNTLKPIMSHVNNFNIIADRDSSILRGLTSNSGFASFYAEKLSVFFTLSYDFSKISGSFKLSKTDTTSLSWSGSGGSHISKVISIDDLNLAINQINSIDDIPKIISLLTNIYNGVSNYDSGVGSDFEVFIATRENPIFVPHIF